MSPTVLILLVFAAVPGWAAPHSSASGDGSPRVTVIQGQTAERGEFPWAAQLKRDGAHVCSAVLLTQQWLVTAAHCLTANLDTSVYQVILGEYDVTVAEGSEQKRGIAEMKFADFSGGDEPVAREENDIALIRLDQPVEFSTYVKTIALPDSKEEFTGQTAAASGWGVSGSTIVGPIFAEKLQKLQMKLLSDSVCLDRLIFFNFVPGPMTCASAASGGSLCWGDSGGALTHYGSAGDQPVLAGVTSWGVDCDLNNRPTVFVDIGFFVDWIKGVIG